MEEDFKKLHKLYNELLKFPPYLRLSFALTALDEASEVLNITPEQINNLRADVQEMLGDFYGNE
jgi:hypothetical protein